MVRFPIALVVLLAIFSFVSTEMQILPAAFWIEVLSSGKTFPVFPVVGLTFITVCIPFAVAITIFERLRGTPASAEALPGQTGLYLDRPKKWLAMAIGAPVFVNDKKVGHLINGRTLFVPLEPGVHEVRVGGKKRDDSVARLELGAGDQPRCIVTSIEQGGFVFAEKPSTATPTAATPTAA